MGAPDTNTPATPVTGADVSNAKQLTQIVGQISGALNGGSAAVITALTAIATAITNSIIGGTTGNTADRALTAKGTTGRALQPSPVAIDSSSNVTPSTTGMALRTNTSNGNTLKLQAYDVDGTTYVDVATATAANTPTFDLLSTTTKGGAPIAIATQTDFISGLIPNVTDRDYRLVVNLPYGLTITETTTICASGTSTFTFKINTTALGGTANSVSTSEETQSHSTSNIAAAGDDLVITASSSSACQYATFTITFTRTLST